MKTLLFVASGQDEQGVAALECVPKVYGTLVLKEGEFAPKDAIAVFSLSHLTVDERGRVSWPSVHLRVAAHKTSEFSPEWAKTTPFGVVVRKAQNERKKGGLRPAMLQVVQQYERWLSGRQASQAPWIPNDGALPTTNREQLEEWLDRVEKSIGFDALQAILATRAIKRNLRDRGGAVVYTHLPIEKVFTGASDFNFGQAEHVSFGTSALASPHDLFQALKTAVVVGKPLQFFTYGEAHDLGRHLLKRLLPSLQILGEFSEEDLTTLMPKECWELKATGVILGPESVAKAFELFGLNKVVEDAVKVLEEGVTADEWYRVALRLLAEEFLKLVGKSVPFEIVADPLHGLASGMNLNDLAQQVEEAAGHEVSILNGPQGEEITSRERLTDDFKVSAFFNQGYWLAGASIYHLWYRSSAERPFVAMVNNGEWGNVNLLARRWMKESNKLFVCPVGYFRIYPKSSAGEEHHVSIDPWVLLHLLRSWGKVKSSQAVRQMWKQLEVPLQINNIGLKTYIYVTADGIETRMVSIDE